MQTVTACVTEYPVAYEHSYGLTVLLTSLDVPSCKARLYVSDAGAAALRPGDEITAEVKLCPSTQRYGAETDAYTSKGIYLIGNIKEGSRTQPSLLAENRCPCAQSERTGGVPGRCAAVCAGAHARR